MPSPVILARNNVAFNRPDWNNLQIDPQAPEAQGLYVSASVPLNRSLASTQILPYTDQSTYRWPISWTANAGAIRGWPDPTVGSYTKNPGTPSTFRVILNPPPPATANATVAIWVRTQSLAISRELASFGGGVAIQTGSDVSTQLLFRWNNASVAAISGIVLPIDEWALAVGTHTGGNSTIYLFQAGSERSFTQADTNITRVISQIAAGTIGVTPLGADYAELAFWARAFTPQEVRNLWAPETRWRRYYVPKTYWQFGDTPVADTQPFAAQPPRPKYIGLNAFSPQAQGLLAWMPVIDGQFVQTNTPGYSRLNQEPILTNVPNQLVPRARRSENGAGPDATLGVAPSVPSDLGLAVRSFQTIDTNGKRQQLCFNANVDLSAQTTLTMVYWIFPIQSNVTEAGYWQTNNGGSVSVNTGVTFTGLQTLSFATDPHIPGRWQMMTVSRTLSSITVWRDQTLIGTVSAVGTAVDAQEFFPEFIIAKGVNAITTVTQGVNALWADFRIYNREWKQPDVDYAYNVKTRWDYYADVSIKPWELPLTPTPPVVTFLSRLALMGAG